MTCKTEVTLVESHVRVFEVVYTLNLCVPLKSHINPRLKSLDELIGSCQFVF